LLHSNGSACASKHFGSNDTNHALHPVSLLKCLFAAELDAGLASKSLGDYSIVRQFMVLDPTGLLVSHCFVFLFDCQLCAIFVASGVYRAGER
jgi:hypothetical protein